MSPNAAFTRKTIGHNKPTYSIAMFDVTMGVELLNKIGQIFLTDVVLGESLMGEK